MLLAAAGRARHPTQIPHLSRRILTDAATKDAIRALLRETAQPVAVLTSVVPVTDATPVSDANPANRVRGATLSSFTSIAMDPYPLVAFSLRVPSRLAFSLKSWGRQATAVPHMVVNLLSSSQSQAAIQFSRPDLYATPFISNPHTLTEEGLPVLTGSLGALSCSLVSCMSLHDLQLIRGDTRARDGVDVSKTEEGGIISELFIARVLRVETMKDHHTAALPLLYHRRQYATAHPIDLAER